MTLCGCSVQSIDELGRRGWGWKGWHEGRFSRDPLLFFFYFFFGVWVFVVVVVVVFAGGPCE